MSGLRPYEFLGVADGSRDLGSRGEPRAHKKQENDRYFPISMVTVPPEALIVPTLGWIRLPTVRKKSS